MPISSCSVSLVIEVILRHLLHGSLFLCIEMAVISLPTRPCGWSSCFIAPRGPSPVHSPAKLVELDPTPGPWVKDPGLAGCDVTPPNTPSVQLSTPVTPILMLTLLARCNVYEPFNHGTYT